MTTPQHILAVCACIRNHENEILLIKNPERGWEPPGGQVEEGESLIQALVREINEETGIEARIGPLVGIYSRVTPPVMVIFGFLGWALSGQLITSEESLAVEWMKGEKALQMVSLPCIHDRLSDMLAFSGKVLYRAYTLNPYNIQYETSLSGA